MMDPVTGNLLMVICFVVGSGLILLEAFMPGFGVAGLIGIVLEIAGIVITGNVHGTGAGVIAAVLVLLIVGLAIFLSYRSAVRGRLSRSPLILKDAESAQEGASALAGYVSREGVTVSSLRPAGFVEIDGVKLNAATSGPFLEKGVPVRVTGAEGDHLVVCRKES